MLPWLISAAVAGTLVINHLQEKEEERAPSSGIYEVDSMTGRQFEEFLSIYFRKVGYDVTLTLQTQDYGADLILSIEKEWNKNYCSGEKVEEACEYQSCSRSS